MAADSAELMARLRHYGVVEVGCGDMQLSFDRLLKERRYNKDRDYTRKEVIISRKNSRVDIRGWIYTLI